jgi:glycosyltransferase involved in cell wall biosynthesis
VPTSSEPLAPSRRSLERRPDARIKVSVIVATYQQERFIADALEGILAQQVDFPWEIVVGDDASTDGNRDVIRDFQRRHPDLIRTHFPGRNLGHGGRAIFAEMVRGARGDYLAMLDGEDYWIDQRKLAKQAAFLDRNGGCAMCFHNAIFRLDDGSAPDRPITRRWQRRRLGMRSLLGSASVASCSPMFRRDALAPLPEWYQDVIWGDWELYLLAAQHGWVGYIPDVMGVYRPNDGGITWNDGDSELERAGRLARFHEELRGRFDPSLDATFARARAKSLFLLAQAEARAGDLPGARESLTRSFEARGVRPRPQDVRRLVLRLRLRLA